MTSCIVILLLLSGESIYTKSQRFSEAKLTKMYYNQCDGLDEGQRGALTVNDIQGV